MAAVLYLLAGAMVFGTSQGQCGQNGTWLNSVTSGNWGTSANWQSGTIADGATYTAIFQNITSGSGITVTLDTSRTIGNLLFSPNTRTWTLNSSGGSTLTLDNTGGANPPVIRAVNAGGCNVSVVLAGTQGIRSPDQVGTVTLSAANTYSGNTEISKGTLQVGNASALPSGGRTGNIVFTNYSSTLGTLDLNGNSITINGLAGSSTGNIGKVTSGVAGTATLTLGDNDASGAFYGVIANGSGTVALTKIGTGEQVLSGVQHLQWGDDDQQRPPDGRHRLLLRQQPRQRWGQRHPQRAVIPVPAPNGRRSR